MLPGIIVSGHISQNDAAILRYLWVVGVIPLFVGIALIINGLFVSKKIVESAKRESVPKVLGEDAEPRQLRAADPAEFIPAGLSVTEETTKQLSNSGQKQ